MSKTIINRRPFMIGVTGTVAAFSLIGCALPAPTPENQRNIGFDLWSGVPSADFGSRLDKTVGSRRINGPRNWTHPITGEKLRIYVRENREKNGVRIQYFTKRPDGTALARVFDRRPGQAEDRYFVGDAFVPQGMWGDGETRRYTLTEYQGGDERSYRITLRMLRADYTTRGRSGSMRYDWILNGRLGKTVFHERYTFSPGVGFVDYDNRL